MGEGRRIEHKERMRKGRDGNGRGWRSNEEMRKVGEVGRTEGNRRRGRWNRLGDGSYDWEKERKSLDEWELEEE